jgi:hypothetical protein
MRRTRVAGTSTGSGAQPARVLGQHLVEAEVEQRLVVDAADAHALRLVELLDDAHHLGADLEADQLGRLVPVRSGGEGRKGRRD